MTARATCNAAQLRTSSRVPCAQPSRGPHTHRNRVLDAPQVPHGAHIHGCAVHDHCIEGCLTGRVGAAPKPHRAVALLALHREAASVRAHVTHAQASTLRVHAHLAHSAALLHRIQVGSSGSQLATSHIVS